MARLSDLPEDVRPRFATAALVTVDVQCDVLDGGPLEIRGTSDAPGPDGGTGARLSDGVAGPSST